ncbi:MAG: hypothetical protein KAR35_10920 [Candidatus Heimdallarchaeota archaeon]|nr:hypothetical protein [Candidatus Heimdallarchaeota archaeon]MCK5049871.1 hypothetical protein [Candidatus Heimdallarchaeota archaeon]
MKLRKEYQVIIIISFLVAMIGITETNFPDQLQLSEYHYVKEHRIISSPDKFEETKISSAAVIIEIVSVNASYDLATTLNDLLLEIEVSFNLEKYDNILYRGIAFLTTKGFIEVSEVYKFNASVYYYSAPGIVLFLVLFFYYFTFDFKKLLLKPRRNKDT